jgi:hypothetical protein
MNIIFIGDSTTLFYNLSFKKEMIELFKDEVSEVYPAEWFESHSKINFEGHDITFIWKSAMSCSRVNKLYLEDRISQAGVESLDESIVLLAFGTVDVRLKIESVSQIDDIVFRYIKKSLEFSNSHNVKMFFTTPIIHPDYADPELTEYFHQSLSKTCKNLGLSEPINIFDVIEKRYSSEPWDVYLHLDTKNSQIALKYIIDCLKNKI